jgi:hypothetical protein
LGKEKGFYIIKPSIRKVKIRLGVVTHVVIPATWEEEIRGLLFNASPDKNTRPYLKYNKKQKRCGLGSKDRVPT